MAISQNAICDRPSVAAKPTHTVPKTKTTCVSTRSKRRSSFLSEALRASTSRSTVARFETTDFDCLVSLMGTIDLDGQLKVRKVGLPHLSRLTRKRGQVTLLKLRA